MVAYRLQVTASMSCSIYVFYLMFVMCPKKNRPRSIRRATINSHFTLPTVAAPAQPRNFKDHSSESSQEHSVNEVNMA